MKSFRELLEVEYPKPIKKKTVKINSKEATNYYFKTEDDAELFYKKEVNNGKNVEHIGANTYVTVFESGENTFYDDMMTDSSLRSAFYELGDVMIRFEDNLKDGNYKNYYKEFQKVIKCFEKFKKTVKA